MEERIDKGSRSGWLFDTSIVLIKRVNIYIHKTIIHTTILILIPKRVNI